MINIEEFKEWMESPDGQKHLEHFSFQNQLRINNINRIKKMFSDSKTFDLLVNRIIMKLDDNYKDRCYSKGIMPHPSNLLYAFFDLVEQEGKEIGPLDGLTENFPSDIYEYNDWQFALTFGQGTASSVYYKKELKYRD